MRKDLISRVELKPTQTRRQLQLGHDDEFVILRVPGVVDVEMPPDDADLIWRAMRDVALLVREKRARRRIPEI